MQKPPGGLRHGQKTKAPRLSTDCFCFLSGAGGIQIEPNEASLIENEDFLLKIQWMLDIVEDMMKSAEKRKSE